MTPTNDKPGARGNEQTGPDTAEHYGPDYTPSNREVVKTDLLSLISRRIWVLAYVVEEARERYVDRRQLLRQAAACLILALLRLVAVRI